ncbi:hypothetical protein J7U46_22365 [Pelomonas sp. V22]|uniref:DUF6980 family protein n=1 Tax=Pelomonas sp. V22 TaxID=2822139 RepID=UPI0024A8BBB9|nr:hypothetical protein [Pelomonas sp. V22]MDI4635827.1 hypothetical protein [Pelomonas sp. V22]
MKKHCCDEMQSQAEFACSVHDSASDCPDALVSYSDKFREYGLFVHDGGTSSKAIGFCPWCGTKLPESLREQWFAELAALGIEDPWSQEIPVPFRTGAWYRGA